jgi:hypothetical protein
VKTRLSRFIPLLLAAVTNLHAQSNLPMGGDSVFSSPQSSADRTDSPRLEISSTTVTVRGVVAGGKVLIVGAGRKQSGPRWGITRRQYIRPDTDNDGVVTVDQIPSTEFIAWAAIDLQTGSHSVATATGTKLRRIDLARSIKRGANGLGTSISSGRAFIAVVWVRPGVGAWSASVGDGGQSDADHAVNGRATCDPEAMRPVGTSPPAPKHILPSDTVIIIDPFTTEIFASEELK